MRFRMAGGRCAGVCSPPRLITTSRAPIKLEAVLANENVLRSGNYNVRFRVWGPEGIAWDHPSSFVIPEARSGEDGPLAVPVLSKDVTIEGPAGAYKLIPYIEEGAAPPESEWEFYLTDPASLPRLNQHLRLWGIPDSVEAWLKSHGASTEAFKGAAPDRREVILVEMYPKRRRRRLERARDAARQRKFSRVPVPVRI